MRFVYVLLIIGLLAATSSSQACSDNMLGIYFDTEATITGYNTPNSNFDYYLVLSNPSIEYVLGFEFDLFTVNLGLDGHVIPFGLDSFPDDTVGLVISSGFSMAGAYLYPRLIESTSIVLLSSTGYYGTDGGFFWIIQPQTAGSAPGRIIVADGNGDYHDGTANIDPGLGVTAWVGDYTVGTEDMTFGDVKALYR